MNVILESIPKEDVKKAIEYIEDDWFRKSGLNGHSVASDITIDDSSEDEDEINFVANIKLVYDTHDETHYDCTYPYDWVMETIDMLNKRKTTQQ